jgi:hypothetical protein
MPSPQSGLFSSNSRRERKLPARQLLDKATPAHRIRRTFWIPSGPFPVVRKTHRFPAFQPATRRLRNSKRHDGCQRLGSVARNGERAFGLHLQHRPQKMRSPVRRPETSSQFRSHDRDVLYCMHHRGRCSSEDIRVFHTNPGFDGEIRLHESFGLWQPLTVRAGESCSAGRGFVARPSALSIPSVTN